MKYLNILSMFLLLALMVTSTPWAYASEITGTLSGGNAAPSGGNGSSAGGSSTLGGTVSGESTSSGGSGSRSGNPSTGSGDSSTDGGSVLGASTDSYTNNVSSDGTALQAHTSGGLAVNYGEGEEPIAPDITEDVGDTPLDYSSAAAVGDISSFSPMIWFWIILLILLLMGTIIYIYNHNGEETRTRLH